MVAWVLAAGCSQSRIKPAEAPTDGIETISLCELKRDGKAFVDKRVRIDARYKSDGARYEFFADASCKERGPMLVSYITSSGDASVKAFYDQWSKRCRDRGLNYCAEDARVVADVTVVAEPDGSFGINLLRVLHFSDFGSAKPR